MNFDNVARALNNYFGENRLFNILLPLDAAIVYAVAGLNILNQFVSLGSFVTSLLTYALFVGVLLSVSKLQYKLVAIGLGAKAICYAYSFLESLIRYQRIGYGVLLSLAVYGLFAYLAYKKTLQMVK